MAQAAQTQSKSTNGFAIAALITGLIPGLGLLGVIFGFVAKSQIKNTHEGGHGMAVAGIILGFAQLLFGIIYMIFVFWIFSSFSQAVIESPYILNEAFNNLPANSSGNFEFSF